MNAYGEIQRIYVRAPDAEAMTSWKAYGWHAEPDVAATVAEHDAFVDILRGSIPDVVVGRTKVPGDPDAIYAYDPVLVTDDGVIPLRPGKEGRRGEPAVVTQELGDAGCAVLPPLEEPATAEGGDMLFLDARTLLVGIGYRTNPHAVAAFENAFPGVQVLTFDLPHWNGRGEVMHLMSFISPLDGDLAVVYPRIAPVRLLELLAERGIEVIEVPDEEFETQGSNVLALGPRRALALDGNPETRRRMERAGVDVVVYCGD